MTLLSPLHVALNVNERQGTHHGAKSWRNGSLRRSTESEKQMKDPSRDVLLKADLRDFVTRPRPHAKYRGSQSAPTPCEYSIALRLDIRKIVERGPTQAEVARFIKQWKPHSTPQEIELA